MAPEPARPTSARTRLVLGAGLLLALAATTSGLAWFAIVKRGAERASAEASGKRVLPFEPGDAVGLRLRLRGEEARLERRDGRWRLLTPVAADADAVAVDQLLSRLSRLERRAVSAPAGEPAARLREYGIGEGSTRVEVTLADGRALSLALGDGTGFDGAMFVQPASGEVQVVAGGSRMDLEKSAFELRERRLLRFEPSALERAEIAGPRGAWSLLQGRGGWTLAAPGLPAGERADPRKAEDVVAALRALSATAFEDGEPPPGKPAWTVDLAFAGGGSQRLLAWSAAGAGGAPLVVRAPGQAQLARLPPASLAPLDVDAATLRDRHLLAVDREAVTAVRLEVAGASGGGFTLARTPGEPGLPDTWKLSAPAPGPVEPWKAQGLLLSLTGLEADRIADETGRSAAAAGLDPAGTTWVLLGKDGVELGRLAVGREAEGAVRVRTGASRRIWTVARERLASLPKSAAELGPAEARP